MKTPTEKLVELVMPYLVKEEIIAEGQLLDKEWLSKAINTLKERAKTLVELAHSLRFYIAEDVEYDEKARAKFLNEKYLPYLKDVKEELEKVDTFAAPEIEKIFTTLVEKHTTKLGNIAQPVRVAITGKTESPGIFEVLEIVGKEKVLKRLERAIGKIG
jgi:glutamyl-tRNA synthetase